MHKRLLKCHLLVIDDIMMFALDKIQAVALFNFVNQLHEKASFIVTTNKSPEQWVKMLDCTLPLSRDHCRIEILV